MQKTEKLKLPIYDTPEIDVFNLQDWNEANKALDGAYKDVLNFREELPKVNANAEIIEAREGAVTLGANVKRISSSLEQNKQEINVLKPKIDSLASGSPKGIFATLSALQSDTNANTDEGKKNIYVVSSDGSWYYWNGTTWAKGGVYQSIKLANSSINIENLNYINYEESSQEVQTIELSKGDIVDNEWVRTDNGNIAVNNLYCHTSYIPVQKGDKITLSDSAPSSLVVNYDLNKQFIGGITTGTNPSTLIPYTFTITDERIAYIIVNMTKSKISYDNYKVMCERTTTIVDKFSVPKQIMKLNNLGTDVLDIINNKNNDIAIYTDEKQLRKQIGNVLLKLQNEENVNVLMFGDSIMNFQNANQLTIDKQKIAPIGLCGENISRRLWKMLNYNVYNNDRTQIVNENGNMIFRRFDHSDWVFSNGYCGTNSMTTQDWATNRADDTSKTWRNNPFNGSPATGDRMLTPESTYNIPMVGTLIKNATATITIPSSAIGCRVVFGKNHMLHSTKSLKISVTGLDDVIIDPSINGQTLNYYQDFTFPSGIARTVTITNVGGDSLDTELWLWGIEYWTGNFVRVTNMGLASNSAELILSKIDKIPKTNIDLIVIETSALNDASLSTYKVALEKAKQLFSKLKELNVPILPIIVHRTLGTSIKYDRKINQVGDKGLVPIYIKNYKAILASLGLDYIDMWSKSIDLTGGELIDNPTFPDNFLIDWGHLNTKGNESYEEELRKVFLWSDVK